LTPQGRRQLGRAARVVCDKENTVLIGSKGNRVQIDGRLAQIRREIEKTTSQYDKEKLEERLVGRRCAERLRAPEE
jgi:chaperonin GroEL